MKYESGLQFSLSLGYKEELKVLYDGLDHICKLFSQWKESYVSNWQYINDNIP